MIYSREISSVQRQILIWGNASELVIDVFEFLTY
jgi:hypothetical protein